MSEAANALTLQRARAGSREALGEVLQGHRALIERLARQVVGSGDDCEDVVQETVIAVATGLPRFRGDCTVKTWIAGITVRIALRHAQRRRRDQGLRAPMDLAHGVAGSPGRSGDPSAALQAGEFRQRLQAAVDALPPDRRTVFALRHVEDLSLMETAEVLGIPLGTVKSRLHHAREAVREMMAPYLEGEGGER